MVEVHDSEDVANHAGPESCGAYREVRTEALAGETGRLGIEPRNHTFKTPTLLGEAEGNMTDDVTASDQLVLRGRQTPGMSGSLLHRSWEISSTSAGAAGGATKAMAVRSSSTSKRSRMRA